jgi:hypothetical protein
MAKKEYEEGKMSVIVTTKKGYEVKISDKEIGKYLNKKEQINKEEENENN